MLLHEKLDQLFAPTGGPCRPGGAAPALAKTPPISADWKARIADKWWSTARIAAPDAGASPQQKALQQLLLGFGGEEACLAFKDSDEPKIIARGQLWSGAGSIRTRGEPCRCHQNSVRLFASVLESCSKESDAPLQDRLGLAVATGYALSNDGMWRQHSWCIERMRRGVRPIETTEPRVAYFGFVLSGQEVIDMDEGFGILAKADAHRIVKWDASVEAWAGPISHLAPVAAGPRGRRPR